MKKLKFLQEYITKPRTVGAVAPSSRFLANKMVAGINFDTAKCIVEYGAGTGPFTKEILARRKPGTIFITFEMNEKFCDDLKERYGEEKDFHIINSSAENIGEVLMVYGVTKADYIVSGLPFASLPTAVSTRILEATVAKLSKTGAFITFQYTLLKKDLIQGYFTNIKTSREPRNVPPAYVLYCDNNEREKINENIGTGRKTLCR